MVVPSAQCIMNSSAGCDTENKGACLVTGWLLELFEVKTFPGTFTVKLAAIHISSVSFAWIWRA